MIGLTRYRDWFTPPSAARAAQPDVLGERRDQADLAARAEAALRPAHEGLLDAAPSPRDPDPHVFGLWRELLSDPGWPARYCGCGAGWSIHHGVVCWACGATVTGD